MSARQNGPDTAPIRTRTDSILIDRAIKYYQVMIMSHDSLLLDRKKTFSKDSLDIYLDHFVSYYPFNETATTYKRVLSDQDLTIDSEDTLIQHYMNLHSIVYPNLHEWFFIEKDFVLNTALPYMDKNAPFVYPTPKRKSFDGSVFYTLRNDDVFMNYLKSGRLYKESTITSLTRVFAYVKYIKGKTHQYIAEENRKEESNKE